MNENTVEHVPSTSDMRYEVAIFDPTGNTMETVYGNETTSIAGYFCDLDRAQHEFMNGRKIAICYDRHKHERFYLRDIDW